MKEKKINNNSKENNSGGGKEQPTEEKKGKTAEEREEEIEEEPRGLDLPTLLVWFISLLSGKAWEYLGLIMNPETKQVNKDLKKAKISIDTIAFLFEQIKDSLPREDLNRIESLLANLRMNYVEKLKEV